MGILIGGFLFVFGLIFFLVGGGISLLGDLFSGNLSFDVWKINTLAFGGLGLVFMIIGAVMLVRGLARAKKLKALAEKIYQYGLPAEGTVTFADKNYRVLVNQKPIYSIVEFKFRDAHGKEHIGRKNNVSSDLVIRLKIEVGSKVQVKYLAENPEQNILMLKDPNSAG